jgi:hypothetical protein
MHPKSQLMNRPAGVTILANLYRTAGGILAVVGIVLIVIGFFLFFKDPLLGLIAIYSVIFGLVSVAKGTIGWWIGRGLAELKNWARISAIVLSMLSLFYVLPLVEMLFGFFAHAWLLLIPWLGLVGLITWYLLSNDVKAAFQGQLTATKRADVGRPAGVTVIAILYFCVAAFGLRFALIGFTVPVAGTPRSQPSDIHSIFRLLVELWRSWGCALIAGALAALMGWGLWQRSQWHVF